MWGTYLIVDREEILVYLIMFASVSGESKPELFRGAHVDGQHADFM